MMGPTDRPEPAAGDESSVVVASTNEHAEERASTNEHAEESCTAEADEMAACMQRADAEADEMAASMQQRVDALPGKAHESEPFTIFRVAGPMRDRNRHLYEPQMVSVGPFHRGAARLRAMEEHKWRYLRDLLARNPDDAPLAAYARAARELEPMARRRYAEPVPLSPREFAEMLLLDGCFIVEFFLKGEDRAADALVDAAWAMQNVYNDLFLIENQLPFFVVERFYDIATGGLGRDYLVTNLLAKYLTMDTPQDAATARPPDGEILHLLHLYYHWFLPPEDRTGDSGSGGGVSSKEEDEAWDEWLAKPIHERMPWQMPPATELQDAGVTFRAKKSPRSLVDVTFSRRDGVLEIPTVENYTNRAMLANLVAYEQSRGRWELQRVASYVLLMASVADGRRDVEALHCAGVLAKGDDETAAFYAHLCPPPEAVNNCYGELYGDVREYSGRSWNRHRAVLVHDYFSNPWTSMSAAAAVLLLVLTVVQTVYTVLPYYHPS